MRKGIFESNDCQHLNYIFNLNHLCEEVQKNRNRIKWILSHEEVFPPYYYYLSRIYADGYALSSYAIPPLAIVQPYHSERIKAQKGVFTVFPFYSVVKDRERFRNIGINPDSMTFHSSVQDCLYKIVLQSPQKIAHEILENGMNESWLYPEMPVVSGEIEHRAIY